MRKKFIILVLALIPTHLLADEGMWLVNLIGQELQDRLIAAGVKIPYEQIYSEEYTSIKDAIVAIDHGTCSGTIISPEGLMITNHHCAYSDIHAKSTIENNYLENGFWAADKKQEIPIEGKSVTFLRKVEDVTARVTIIADSLDQISVRGARFLGKVESILTREIDTPYQLSLHSMWRGQKYYLYFYETFEDVRLVAAPPVSIGAFGGEQDNWSWPQHKGDFTIYRAACNGEVAAGCAVVTANARAIDTACCGEFAGFVCRRNGKRRASGGDACVSPCTGYGVFAVCRKGDGRAAAKRNSNCRTVAAHRNRHAV